MYQEYRFQNPEQARQKRREINKKYGYHPEIYLVQPNPNSKETFFAICHPRGLVPVNKKTMFEGW